MFIPLAREERWSWSTSTACVQPVLPACPALTLLGFCVGNMTAHFSELRAAIQSGNPYAKQKSLRGAGTWGCLKKLVAINVKS